MTDTPLDASKRTAKSLWQQYRIHRDCSCALAAAICLLGCEYHYVSTAPKALDSVAKSFVTASNSSNIYLIYVAERWLGVGWLTPGCCAFLDGTQIEQLGDNQYRLLHVSPGAHVVGECRAPVALTTEGGKNYYVCITLVSGGFIREASYRVEILGDQQGRDLVIQSRLAGKRH